MFFLCILLRNQTFIMAKIKIFLNLKGEAGKTTSTVNIGAVLNRLGKNVLFIDLDPLANNVER